MCILADNIIEAVPDAFGNSTSGLDEYTGDIKIAEFRDDSGIYKYKKNGSNIEARPQSEIDAEISQLRSADNIETEIFASFTDPDDLDQVSTALEAAFLIGSRRRNWGYVRSRVAKALQTNKITQAQYDIIDAILPD